MIIVAGSIHVAPENRERFVAASLEAVALARQAPGCLDFVVAPDPLDPGRVNVYEQWESAEHLESFRGDGPGDDLTTDILSADVQRHEIASSGPA